MYRVVIWHWRGHEPGLTRGHDGDSMPLLKALDHAAELRKKFCVPGGGLHSVGIEEVKE